MANRFPTVPFERYADDSVVHCKSEAQAREVLAAIAQRMAEVGLELHPGKTRLVYCKDKNRKGSAEHEQFTFLGYTFRPRLAVGKFGPFVGFLPAISDDAAKAIRQEIKSWRLHLRNGQTLLDLARDVNPIVQGWVSFYGRFYGSELNRNLGQINHYLLRWAKKKYKRLRGSKKRVWAWLEAVALREPVLFAHWRAGARP